MKKIVVSTVVGLVLLSVAYSVLGSYIKPFFQSKNVMQTAPIVSQSVAQQSQMHNENIKVALHRAHNKAVSVVMGCMSSDRGCHCYSNDGKPVTTTQAQCLNYIQDGSSHGNKLAEQ